MKKISPSAIDCCQPAKKKHTGKVEKGEEFCVQQFGYPDDTIEKCGNSAEEIVAFLTESLGDVTFNTIGFELVLSDWLLDLIDSNANINFEHSPLYPKLSRRKLHDFRTLSQIWFDIASGYLSEVAKVFWSVLSSIVFSSSKEFHRFVCKDSFENHPIIAVLDSAFKWYLETSPLPAEIESKNLEILKNYFDYRGWGDLTEVKNAMTISSKKKGANHAS